MSGRNGAGHSRPGAPQPLKATVPFKLASKPRPNRRDGRPAGKVKLHQLSSGMRRTMSLDAIIGPYLQGHWPKEPETQSSLSRKDKSTQTPDSWVDKSRSKKASSSHKRSASWGSADHLQEIAKLKQHLQQCSKPAVSGGHDKDRQCFPQGSCSLGATRTQPIPIPLSPLSTLVPRLRCSVEGLNQELEGMFISQSPPAQHRLLEVPDGHRAPVPLRGCNSDSQSDSATSPLSSSSTSSSPCSSPHLQEHHSSHAPHQGFIDGAETCHLSPLSCQNEADLPLLISSSPALNKSCCFQREPPEGCEKVRVWEEISASCQEKQALVSSCPDPNKVNFTPHGGSAFCPVSLLKPLLPSMDLLFRSLTATPVTHCSSQETSSCQAVSSGIRSASPDPSASSTVKAESSGEGLAF